MKLLFVCLFVALIPLFAFVCSRKQQADCLEGKIIRITCASTVIQVTNVDSLGQDGWSNTMDSSAASYNNVFSVVNKCDLPATIKEGQRFSFKRIADRKDDCIVCMMYDAPPEVRYSVEICD